MQNVYGICIGDYITESNFLFCTCENKTAARASARLYKKQWQIREPILAIVLIPPTIINNADDASRRAYATAEALRTSKKHIN